jgi:hypothetical protein
MATSEHPIDHLEWPALLMLTVGDESSDLVQSDFKRRSLQAMALCGLADRKSGPYSVM